MRNTAQKLPLPSKPFSESRIAAIVVTYNRKALLLECLQSLVSQSRPLDAVFVIDNCSGDDTDIAVTEFAKTHPVIQYVRMDSNTGGAGGFHAGVKKAYEQGFDWIWLMDDDVEAYSDALEGLGRYSDKSLCLHGRRTKTDGQVYMWEAHFNPTLGFAVPSADKGLSGTKDFCQVNVGCFEGMLVHRSIVDKIGYPDARFFIAWDDTVYGYLASKWTDVLYIKHLTLKRKRAQKTLELGFRSMTEVSDLYRFYHIRNRWLVKEYLRPDPKFCALCFDLMTGVFFAKEIMRALVLQRNFSAIKPLFRGLVAGYEGK